MCITALVRALGEQSLNVSCLQTLGAGAQREVWSRGVPFVVFSILTVTKATAVDEILQREIYVFCCAKEKQGLNFGIPLLKNEQLKEPQKRKPARQEENCPSGQGELTFERRHKSYGMLLQAVMSGKLQSVPWTN